MYEFIYGKMVDLAPTHVVVEAGGIGYHIQITINTYTGLSVKKDSGGPVKLFLHQVVREDAHLLFGFENAHERQIFRLLIMVSGIGANTARMILSSLRPEEVEQAILSADVNLLKSIRGIGLKTAQRVIVDLKDKVGKSVPAGEIFSAESNTIRQESLSALVTLGFPKSAVEKVLDKILAKNKTLSVENLIKLALKEL
jgi:holliday junction DNA helicase RuvA